MSIANCPHCGGLLSGHELVCPRCGGQLNSEATAVPPEGAPPAPPRTEQEAQQAAFRQFHADLRKLTPLAPVTPILIAANVIVFLLMMADGVYQGGDADIAKLLSWGASHGSTTIPNEPWRLLTTAFIHGSIAHIAMNMLFLAAVGATVERLVGSVGFLLLYISTALVGSLASVAWAPSLVAVGASGAVFGVYGALIAAAKRAGDTMPEPAWQAFRKGAIACLGINLVFGLAVPNIDMAAHVGGLIWGLACGWILGQPVRAESLRGRFARNGLVAIASVGVVSVGFVIAQDRVSNTIDPVNEWDQIGSSEERVLKVYNDAVQHWNQGKLTDAEFLAILEKDVLPPWRDTRLQIDRLRKARAGDLKLQDQYRQYFVLREDGWELMIRALREKNEHLYQEADEKMQQADRLAQSISQNADRKKR